MPDRLPELRGYLEKLKLGVDQFLHEERGSARWSSVTRLIGGIFFVAGGGLTGEIIGYTVGLVSAGALTGISPEKFFGPQPNLQPQHIEFLALSAVVVGTFGMVFGAELTTHVGAKLGLVTRLRS